MHLSITVAGQPAVLDLENLGPKDAKLFRKATGTPLMSAFNEDGVDLDIICALWWLARRHAGEGFLTYDQAAAAFPSMAHADEIDIEFVDQPEDGEDDESPLA